MRWTPPAAKDIQGIKTAAFLIVISDGEMLRYLTPEPR